MAVAEGILTSRGGLVEPRRRRRPGLGHPGGVRRRASRSQAGSFEPATGRRPRRRRDLRSTGTTGEVYARRDRAVDRACRPSSTIVLGWADEVRPGASACGPTPTPRADAARARPSVPRASVCAAPSTCSSAGPAAGRAAHDPRRHPEDEQAALGRAARGAAGRLRGRPRGDGRPAGHGAPARPAAARVPARSSELVVAEARGELDEDGPQLLAAARRWREQNPMLGIRGVRLGIVKPGLYRMQVRALVEAALARLRRRGRPRSRS